MTISIPISSFFALNRVFGRKLELFIYSLYLRISYTVIQERKNKNTSSRRKKKKTE